MAVGYFGEANTTIPGPRDMDLGLKVEGSGFRVQSGFKHPQHSN